MNRRVFFDDVRRDLFGGGLNQDQVDGFNAILDAWAESSLSDLRWLAYMLATTFHETARTMRPIREYGGRTYVMRMYDKTGHRPHVARALGNTEVGDGARFCGRGRQHKSLPRRVQARASAVSKSDSYVDLPSL